MQIALPSGDLLAEAMVHHIQKQDWPDLDDDEPYEKQVRNFKSNEFENDKNSLLKSEEFLRNVKNDEDKSMYLAEKDLLISESPFR